MTIDSDRAAFRAECAETVRILNREPRLPRLPRPEPKQSRHYTELAFWVWLFLPAIYVIGVMLAMAGLVMLVEWGMQ